MIFETEPKVLIVTESEAKYLKKNSIWTETKYQFRTPLIGRQTLSCYRRLVLLKTEIHAHAWYTDKRSTTYLWDRQSLYTHTRCTV